MPRFLVRAQVILVGLRAKSIISMLNLLVFFLSSLADKVAWHSFVVLPLVLVSSQKGVDRPVVHKRDTGLTADQDRTARHQQQYETNLPYRCVAISTAKTKLGANTLFYDPERRAHCAIESSQPTANIAIY